MKTKKLSKKLSLNKKTIADLGNKEMKKAVGGVTGPGTTCLETRFLTCGIQSCGSYCLTLPDIICKACV